MKLSPNRHCPIHRRLAQWLRQLRPVHRLGLRRASEGPLVVTNRMLLAVAHAFRMEVGDATADSIALSHAAVRRILEAVFANDPGCTCSLGRVWAECLEMRAAPPTKAPTKQRGFYGVGLMPFVECRICVRGTCRCCNDVNAAHEEGIAQGRALERKAVEDFLADASECEQGCLGCNALNLSAAIERGEHVRGTP